MVFSNFGYKLGSDSLTNQDSGLQGLKNRVRFGFYILGPLTTLSRIAK